MNCVVTGLLGSLDQAPVASFELLEELLLELEELKQAELALEVGLASTAGKLRRLAEPKLPGLAELE